MHVASALLVSPPCGSGPSCTVAHCCSVPHVLYSRLKSHCVPSSSQTGLSRYQYTFCVCISKLRVWSELALHFALCVWLPLQARSQAFVADIGVTPSLTLNFCFLISYAFCCVPCLCTLRACLLS